MHTIPMTKYESSLVPWILFVVIAVIYLCFPTKNYYWDGIAFAQAIENAPVLRPSLLHPNHLFYEVVGHAWYRLIRGVGIDIRAVQALQILNGLLGALCGLVLFQILKLALRPSYLSIALTLLFAFSATWWKFATDADAYIPSILFLLITFYFILPGRRARPLLVALTFFVSMCFHQLAVIFYPVIVVGLFLQSTSPPVRRRILNPTCFSVVAFVITVATYYYCFYLVTGSFNFINFTRWLTSFTRSDGFKFDAWSNFIFTLRGFPRLFFGGRFNLIKGLINPPIVILLITLTAATLMLVYNVIRHSKKPDFSWLGSLRHDPERRSLALLCVVWVTVYLIFLFIWLPHNTFYRLFYLPPLILLIGLVLSSRETADHHMRKYRLVLLVAIVSIANFLFLIFPYSHAEKYPPLSLALEMNHVWPRGTVVYYAMRNADNSLFGYFNPSTVWKPFDSTNIELLEGELRDIYGKGSTAWLEASAIDQLMATSQGVQWLAKHAKEETRRELSNRAFRIRFIQIGPSGLVDPKTQGSVWQPAAKSKQL